MSASLFWSFPQDEHSPYFKELFECIGYADDRSPCGKELFDCIRYAFQFHCPILVARPMVKRPDDAREPEK